MRELPILFSAPMVRAILEGRKTVTRRVLEPLGAVDIVPFIGADNQPTGEFGWCPHPCLITEHIRPRYRIGDRLYVREAWRAPAGLDDRSGKQIADECLAAGYRAPWCPIKYEADGALNSAEDWREFGSTLGEAVAGRYRHARFMPRWASRLTLEVTAVRVERLQDISEPQARAEGIHDIGIPADECGPNRVGYSAWDGPAGPTLKVTPVEAFRELWESINGAGRWADNPWVWVVEFRRVEVSHG
jgi:hypothetical protein